MTRAHSRGITFINATLGLPVADGAVTSVRVVGSRISAVGCDPQPADLVIDLRGGRLLPGLINAHDHLQLNSFPQPEHRRQHGNVREWIAEINDRLRSDHAFRSVAGVPREHRLLHGGLKNLLSGVTTVAHHDPLYPTLSGTSFPVRVVTNYGWSHSLGIDGENRARRSHESTPADWPWIIHAAEGIDAEAMAEFGRLDSLNCITGNTLLVHGVALGPAQRERLAEAHAGLIWCPSSNLHLFGESADVADLIACGRVALGTDSRLSGAADLLGELRVARAICAAGRCDAGVARHGVERARLLRIRTVVRCGSVPRRPARPAAAAGTLERVSWRHSPGDDRRRHALWGPRTTHGCRSGSAMRWSVRVDGRPKVLDRGLVESLLHAGVKKTVLNCPQSAWRAA